MYQIMRIPQYPRDCTVADAKPLFEVSTLREANQAITVLTEFNTKPPGPMQASPAHHFISFDGWAIGEIGEPARAAISIGPGTLSEFLQWQGPKAD